MVSLDLALVEQIEELLRLQAVESSSGESPTTASNGTSMLRRPKVESRLTPREVQALLRTGRSVGEIAEVAGMSEDWVGRFAPPVLAEQARVVERALVLVYSKPRIGPSMQPLGDSVIWNLAERGTILTGEAAEDAWSAFQQPDGGWVVRVSYLAERRRQHADWTVDMTQGVLKAVNRLGNELGYVEPGRRRPQALPPATPVSASAQRAAASPPKLTPPPPLPARPAGRLSLLGNAGATRPVPSGRTAVPDYRRAESGPPSDWRSAPTSAPSRMPREPLVASPTAPAHEEPMVASPPVAATRPSEEPPIVSIEPVEDRTPPEPAVAPPTRPLGARTPRERPPAAARSTPAPTAKEPMAEDVEAVAEQVQAAPVDAPAASVSPQERRRRPLRPKSADGAAIATPRVPSGVDKEAPTVSADEVDDAPRRGAADAVPGGSARSTPRPPRERPLQAPSRIRRDELARPSAPVTRRPLVAPRVSGRAGTDEADSTASPGTPRPAPPASPRRLGSSRSEEPVQRPAAPLPSRRLGSSRSGEPAQRAARPLPGRLGTARAAEPAATGSSRRLGSRQVTAAPAAGASRRLGDAAALERRAARVERPADAVSPTRSQPVAERFGPPHGEAQRRASTAERFGVGRPASNPDPAPSETANSHALPTRPARLGANRPLRARTTQPARDALVGDEGDADDPDGPITAPVPAVEILHEDGSDTYREPGKPVGGRDQVLIRTGRAGAPESPGERPAVGGKPEPEDRPPRSGLLKLRRRLQGSP